MPLFHKRVIEKHTKDIEYLESKHAEILTAWAENLEKGIYDSETQNDGEFIQRILIDVLGYVGSSEGKEWTVAKNQPVGTGNVDVALGQFSADNSKIIAPFELKGAKTRDLDAVMPGRNKTPVQQAWEYAMDAKGAQWVLVSNYREIRLYAVGYGRKDHEVFDLSKLNDPVRYARFILLLSSENLLSGKTLNLLNEGEQVDKDITKQLYEDYKALRVFLIKNIRQDNPDKDPIDVIKYTQTILDRILFIAFAEDKSLLPENTLKQAYETKNLYNPQPTWENFVGLFRAINKGNPELKIPGYNGGLFADDPELNTLNISDELCEGFKKIGEYDFESDVSVNILGHIFEQSISDLEELKASAEGAKSETERKLSKRKKDGIYYTPAYITRYIVEQAVGGWLNDRKKELGFEKLPELSEQDYGSIKFHETGKQKGKITYNKKIQIHIEAWEAYKEILSNIKVLDPACGSGAFLNEVFDYIKTEGESVNSEFATLKGTQSALFGWDKHILANNIYGVDLNSESVEITKLSLWLKTANRSEKLTYLEDNIKVGNSLIDDPEIAGESAFNWNKEFSEIMDSGGFDVVLGNPPYGATLSQAEKIYIKKRYQATEYNYDTYISFFELAVKLSRFNSYIGFITPNTFLVTENSTKIRELLMIKWSLISLLEIFNVFPDAVVEPIISIVKKVEPTKNHTLSVTTTIRQNLDFSEKIASATKAHYKLKEIQATGLLFNYRASENERNLALKMEAQSHPLSDDFVVTTGIKPYQKGKGKPPQSSEIVKNKPFTSFSPASGNWVPLIRGSDVRRYNLSWSGEYIYYGPWLAEPRIPQYFAEPKLFIRRTDDTLMACFDDTGTVGVNSVHTITPKAHSSIEDLGFLLSLINSRLINHYFQYKNFHMVGKPFAEVKVVFVERLPIVDADSTQKRLINEFLTKILNDTKIFEERITSFLELLKSDIFVEKISRNLENWYYLKFNEFIQEVEKHIKPKKLSLQQKSEWMKYFETEKTKAMALKDQIKKTDNEIDQMVYQLYNLTPEEIALVEAST